jgi:hypothetical protein
MPDFGNSGVKKQASWNNHIWLWIFWWRLRNPLFWWRVRNPLFWWKLRNPPWKKIHRGKKSTKFKIHRGKKSTVEKNPPNSKSTVEKNPPWKKIHQFKIHRGTKSTVHVLPIQGPLWRVMAGRGNVLSQMYRGRKVVTHVLGMRLFVP